MHSRLRRNYALHSDRCTAGGTTRGRARAGYFR